MQINSAAKLDPVLSKIIPSMTADVDTQSRARRNLAGIDKAPHPEDNGSLTLRELMAYRRDGIRDMVYAVERDLYPDRPSGLFGNGPLIGERRADIRDHLRVAGAAGVSLALLGAAVATGGDAALWAVPAGLYGGYVLTDVVGNISHLTSDEFIARPHVPGGKSCFAVDAWTHHFNSSATGIADNMRVAGRPVHVGLGLAAGLLAVGEGVSYLTTGAHVGPTLLSACAGLAIGAPFWLLAHTLTHRFGEPAKSTKALRAIGMFETPAHHKPHHLGDTTDLLPGEQAPRHVDTFQGSWGWLSPMYWLDKAGITTKAVLGVGKLLGKTPAMYREYPAWVQYWEAKGKDKPVAKLNARIDSFKLDRKQHEFDLQVAKRTAQNATREEKAEAESYSEQLTKHLETIDASIAELERRKAELVAAQRRTV